MTTFHVQHAKRLNWCITSQAYQARGILWLWRKCILLLLKCMCVCVCVCVCVCACVHAHTHTCAHAVVHDHMFLHMPVDASHTYPHTPLAKNPRSFFSQPTSTPLIYPHTHFTMQLHQKRLSAVQDNPSGGLGSGSWRDFLMLWRKIVLSPAFSETDWDLGPFMVVLKPGHLSNKIQRKYKELKMTTCISNWGKLWTIRYKKTKETYCHFCRARSKNRVSWAKAGYYTCPCT